MTLEALIKELLFEQGESNLNKFARYLQMGISGLREFSMDTSGVPTIRMLTVNDNGTVDLPSDYINYVRIAVCGADGNLHSLAYNKNMCISVDFDDCGELLPNTGGGVTYLWDSGTHFRNGQNTGGYFGATPANVNGNYRIDEKRRYIVLQNFTGDNIILEYLADIERNSDGKFEVHPYLVSAIKAYIRWMKLENNDNAPIGQTQHRKKIFDSEKIKAERRFSRFTIDEVKEMINKHGQLSPKF